MKKIIRNPEFDTAPYEMRFIFDRKSTPRVTPVVYRFKIPWPDDITAETLWQWVQENHIPEFIEA